MTKLLAQGEAAERILKHVPSEVHVTVLTFEFGFVEGDVGVLVEHERYRAFVGLSALGDMDRSGTTLATNQVPAKVGSLRRVCGSPEFN
jgi:hypothetical protein